jgi:hypothetical protein
MVSIFITTFVVVTLALAVSVDAAFNVNVCFTIAGKGVSNALVKCFDSDWGPDDVVGPSAGVRTGTNGCVALRDTQTWYERPDVYCQIFANGECFAGTTTRIVDDHPSSRDLDLGTLALTYDANYCGNFGAGANGCGPASFPSWLNDVATSVSGFADQCAAHDTCYSSCVVKRTRCDTDFLADMKSICTGSWTCLTLANIYYKSVNEFGGSACTSARSTKCTSTGTALCNQ